jgi:hypothetical protein
MCTFAAEESITCKKDENTNSSRNTKSKEGRKVRTEKTIKNQITKTLIKKRERECNRRL